MPRRCLQNNVTVLHFRILMSSRRLNMAAVKGTGGLVSVRITAEKHPHRAERPSYQRDAHKSDGLLLHPTSDPPAHSGAQWVTIQKGGKVWHQCCANAWSEVVEVEDSNLRVA